ncbi:MAG: GNAT family N-acetyltransferase [Gulosibacter sp.]|uniref:GNAT family N-acetyltransferase n=1 Tax=Gulosibacter sp. TaxID=2817531 RepID=UPI003F8FADF6
MTNTPTNYELHYVDHNDVAATTSWLAATRRAFLDHELRGKLPELYRAQLRESGTQILGMYANHVQPIAGVREPVGTFGNTMGSVNLGSGMLPASLITSATVHPIHRRRGVLRSMMTRALEDASKTGAAVALLTATEATIYGRFGFGAATTRSELEIDIRGGADLRTTGSGTVQEVSPSWLNAHAPAVFERLSQRGYGTVSRLARYNDLLVTDSATGELATKLRAFVHLDESGESDGFALFEVGGFDNRRADILDFVAVTPESYLSLWNVLGHLDLIETLHWKFAAADELLPYALADSRRAKTVHIQDELWVRPLNVIAALEGRGYRREIRESITVRIHDPLEYAAGTFAISVQDGAARVEADASATADLTMDAATFGALFFGAVDAQQLALAGRVEGEPDAVDRFSSMLAAPAPIAISSHF